MPYTWTETHDPSPRQELRAWPHNSLSPQGFAVMILGFYLAASIPFYGLLGTKLFWGLLPFMLVAVGGLWWGLRRNARDREILEVLTITAEQTHLHRTNPRGDVQEWRANTYWVAPHLHAKGGPVPYYVTLKGSGREVEIGAFLSEDERRALHGELQNRLARAAAPQGD